jgi:hypothetical protein
MGVDGDLGLATGMADLHPNMAAASRARLSHGLQTGQSRSVGTSINNDIARPFEMVAIDLHIARNEQTAAAISPKAIKPVKFRRRSSLRVG